MHDERMILKWIDSKAFWTPILFSFELGISNLNIIGTKIRAN